MTAIAFYAPLKSPRHAVPSGDRTMARLFLRAWEAAGHEPVLASELRSFEPSGNEACQRAIAAQGEDEALRLIGSYRRTGVPAAFFTYHCYYKAPDWIGPRVADALAIPYIVAEASRAEKRADGPFAHAHAGCELALARADAILCMTPGDREALELRRPPHQALVDCPPFIDASTWPEPPQSRADGPLRLITVAMMRDGDKLQSYRLLALALEQATDLPWTLDIVGDGPARAQVEALFAPFAPRIRFHGLVEDRGALAACFARAHLFVWPAVNEAFGLAPLEAQGMGCPVLLGDEGGVRSALADGITGRLAPPRDPAAFALLLREMAREPATLARMSAAAARFVRRERTLEATARLLQHTLLEAQESRS